VPAFHNQVNRLFGMKCYLPALSLLNSFYPIFPSRITSYRVRVVYRYGAIFISGNDVTILIKAGFINFETWLTKQYAKKFLTVASILTCPSFPYLPITASIKANTDRIQILGTENITTF